MIKPHGSDTLNPLFVQDSNKRDELLKEAASLPSIVISSQAAANAVMLGSGYFNPLKGYMNLADSIKVAEKMYTADGIFFPVPVLNLLENVDDIKGKERIALKDPNVDGNPIIAIQTVKAIEELSDTDKKMIGDKVYGTDDKEHPGLAIWESLGNFIVSGPI